MVVGAIWIDFFSFVFQKNWKLERKNWENILFETFVPRASSLQSDQKRYSLKKKQTEEEIFDSEDPREELIESAVFNRIKSSSWWCRPFEKEI